MSSRSGGKKALVQAGAAQVEVPLTKLALVTEKEIPQAAPAVRPRSPARSGPERDNGKGHDKRRSDTVGRAVP